jgi:two-component system response regulator AtoC
MSNTKNLTTILLVDDEPAVLETLEIILEEQFRVLKALSGKEALEKITKESVDLVFLDISMPDINGMEILKRMKEYDENLPVIMATATDSARQAVKAMRLGACDYIAKPFDIDEVITVAQKVIGQNKLRREVIYLRSQREEAGFENIIGKSKKIKETFAIIEKVSQNDSTIFISGESGTGKDLIARAIHFNSARKNKPFIPINCASIPENLLESELFGYEKGAFTGAANQRIGMFELANEGTLFLDEISGLRLDLQAKLLRVLEGKEIRRLGAAKIIKIDVRLISATNIDLKQAVQEGKFRQDLYYRLNVLPIYLAPLRERREDIPLLIESFLKKFNQVFRRAITGLSKEALDYLVNYEWPGNVRELKNVVERLVALSDNDIITPKDLPFDIFIKGSLVKGFPSEGGLKKASQDFQKKYIEAVLERTGGNKVKAAKILGIHRNALMNKIKSLGLGRQRESQGCCQP